MITNLLVKNFLARLMGGKFLLSLGTILAYPTLDVRNATITTKTAAYTITQADLDAPTIFDNTGDAGDLPLTLPLASLSAGKVVRAYATAAQTISLTPATGDIINYNGNAVASKYCRLAGVIGNYIEVFSDGVQWIVTQGNGVITKEA